MRSFINSIKRFSDLTPDDVLVEMHTHSTWTDGAASPSEIAATAEQLGLQSLFITDHVRRESTYCEEYIKETSRIAATVKPRITVGFESKIADYDGNLDISKDNAARAEVLIGTVHSVPDNDGFQHPSRMPQEQLERAEYELAMAMLEARSADILGHAGGMSLARFDEFPLDLMEEIIAKSAATDVAFEINSRYHAGLLDWLLEKLEKYNPKVAIGSDAHSLDEVGTCSKLLRERLFGR